MAMDESNLEKSNQPLFVNEDLLCHMCKSAKSNMWRFLCGHIICDECKLIVFQKSSDTVCRYENCNTPINCKTQVFQDKDLQRKIEQQMVYCRFKNRGCDAVIELKDLESHVLRCEGICERCQTPFKRMNVDCHTCRRLVNATEEISEQQIQSVLHVTDHASARVSETWKNCKIIQDNWEKISDACAGIFEGNKHLRASIKKAFETYATSRDLIKVRSAEIDLRMQLMETTNFDGTLIWKIRDYQRRKRDALNGRTLSIYSQPFYTSRQGYKMCGRVYLNGDGKGFGTHLSFYFVIMKGIYDEYVQWPFKQDVTLMLLDQDKKTQNLSETIKPEGDSSSFRKPETEMNIASGIPQFVEHTRLETMPYMQDDTILLFIKADMRES